MKKRFSLANTLQIVTIANAILCLILLVLWSLQSESSTAVSIPSSILNLIVAIQIVAFSQYEHLRSVRPSTILTLYLFISIILDIPQARTLYLIENNFHAAITFSCIWMGKLFLIVLENLDKRKYLRSKYHDLPYETTSGIINRSFLWWINGLFVKGSNSLLSLGDLFELDRVLSSEKVSERMRGAWESRCKFFQQLLVNEYPRY